MGTFRAATPSGALQRLLEDVKAAKVDIIVLYRSTA
jgi:hypothetical protein